MTKTYLSNIALVETIEEALKVAYKATGCIPQVQGTLADQREYLKNHGVVIESAVGTEYPYYDGFSVNLRKEYKPFISEIKNPRVETFEEAINEGFRALGTKQIQGRTLDQQESYLLEMGIAIRLVESYSGPETCQFVVEKI